MDYDAYGDQLLRDIAVRIRDRRTRLQWSLDRLSQVTGLSKGYLSQIENGEKNPPVSTLTKIAFGLKISPITLITGEPEIPVQNKFCLVRKGETQSIKHTSAAPASMYESLGFGKPDRLMDAYIVSVSHEFPERPMMHEGQELAYVLEGEQEFYYDGKIHRIQAGDCLYFDSDRPHMSRSLGPEPSRVLVVFCNPVRHAEGN